MNETPTLYATQHRVFSLNIINLLYIKDMSKETKDSMAVRQHMEAAVNAVQNYYKEDDENRAVFQLLVERKNEEDAGTTGLICMGYGTLLASSIDNAISNCEGFKDSLILALGRRCPTLVPLLMELLSDSNGEEE